VIQSDGPLSQGPLSFLNLWMLHISQSTRRLVGRRGTPNCNSTVCPFKEISHASWNISRFMEALRSTSTFDDQAWQTALAYGSASRIQVPSLGYTLIRMQLVRGGDSQTQTWHFGRSPVSRFIGDLLARRVKPRRL
jgi:hypothetical protein